MNAAALLARPGRNGAPLPALSPLALELLGLLVALRPHGRYQLSPQECATVTNNPLTLTLEALVELEGQRLLHCYRLDSADPLEQTMWGLEDADEAREVVRQLNGYDEDMTPPLPLVAAPGPRQRPSALAERTGGKPAIGSTSA